jgi:16S rRNA (adenine1518-N6/adenine1519-N6)-dimethyltransferase
VIPGPARLLRAHGLRATKALGQHFLRDRSALGRIAALLGPGEGDVVVEIGAGTGALTRALLARGATVRAIERDRGLCELLRAEFADARLTIDESDVRGLDLAAMGEGRPVLVAGNIPYNLSSEIVLALVDQRRAWSRAVLMVQAEFATRMAAPPGGRDYGALSVRCQQYLDVKRAFHVAPGCFHPPPRVRSTVVLLIPRPAPLAPVRDQAAFERLVRDAFGHRRKTLRNALRGMPGLDAALLRARLDGRRRPETLSIAEFARLSDELCPSSPR